MFAQLVHIYFPYLEFVFFSILCNLFLISFWLEFLPARKNLKGRTGQSVLVIELFQDGWDVAQSIHIIRPRNFVAYGLNLSNLSNCKEDRTAACQEPPQVLLQHSSCAVFRGGKGRFHIDNKPNSLCYSAPSLLGSPIQRDSSQLLNWSPLSLLSAFLLRHTKVTLPGSFINHFLAAGALLITNRLSWKTGIIATNITESKWSCRKYHIIFFHKQRNRQLLIGNPLYIAVMHRAKCVCHILTEKIFILWSKRSLHELQHPYFSS